LESKKIYSGIKWASIQFVFDMLFRFSIRLILAKLLLPEQFGLVGMCIVFISLATAASELGMSAALIQKKNDFDAEKLYSTAFWTGIIWGISVFAIMSLLVGPFAAYFFKEPLLMKLIPVLSLGIVLTPFVMVHNVILIRQLNFKKTAKIFNSAVFVAGVIAIIMAFFNFGVWALVINNVLSIALTLPMFYITVKWRPTFEWRKDYFKQFFGFGAYSTGTNIFSTLTYNVDNLMIGKFLGANLLGSYTLSFSLTEQIRQLISSVLNKVMFPVFGQHQDNKKKLKDLYLKIVYINSIAIFPLMVFFILFAKDVIIGFFGVKWEAAIKPLQILSIAMMVHLLVNSFTSLIRGLGKPKLEMKIIMNLTIFVLIPCLYLGIRYAGLVGASLAILCNKIALVIAGVVILKREIGVTFKNIFLVVKSALVAVLISVIIVIGLKYIANVSMTYALMIVYVIIYGLLIYYQEKLNLKNLLTNN
jgi:O-antigen/teichoic acid export membrane protein